MAWIAFACVPAMLVVMLAMGHLEARLLPRTPSQAGFPGPTGADTDAFAGALADPVADDLPEDLPENLSRGLPGDVPGLSDLPRLPDDLRSDVPGRCWEIPATAVPGPHATAARKEARA